MKVSFFANKTSTSAAGRDLEWSEFVRSYLSNHIHPDVKDGPMFSFAIYDERPQRSNANVVGVSGLVADFDNSIGKGLDKRPAPAPTRPEDTLHNLDGHAFAWYSTYSHTTDWPRWRLVVPLSRALTPGEVPAAFDGLLSILCRDENIDVTCGELSRAHFLPACPSEHSGDSFVGAQDGQLITPEELFACASFAPSAGTVILPAQFSSRGGLSKAEGRNDTLKMIVASMASRGEPLERIIAEVHEADQKHNPPLFSDRAEGYRCDSWTGAIRFVSNILWSIGGKRAASGLPPELPLIRREAVPAMEIVRARYGAEKQRQHIERKPIPSHLLIPPGGVGLLCDYINRTAIKPQPALAIAASLSACGTIVGRKVASPTDLRTNLYTLGIAASGVGKDHARKVIKRVFMKVGAVKHLAGEHLASDTGFIEAVQNAPNNSCLFQFDEIGRMLLSISSAKHSPHLLNIPTVLMEFYSSANSLFLGKEYSGRERIDILEPNVCIYGTTVASKFYASLTSDEVSDGFLSRFMMFETDSDPEECEVSDADKIIPDFLVATIKDRLAWPLNADPAGNLDHLNPGPRRLSTSRETDRAFLAFRKEVHAQKARANGTPELLAVWNRAQENAWKVATTIAAFDASGDKIDSACADYAIELTNLLTLNLCAAITGHVAESYVDAALKKVERIVLASGQVGITQSDLLRSMRCTSRDLRPLVDTLAESGQLVAVTRKTGQRASTYWVHAAKAIDEQAA